MLYSRFDAARGLYDVFADALQRPVNADLPVPSVGPSMNGIGVPASLTGRRLPGGARRVGQSWHARGIIVAPAAGVGLGATEVGGSLVGLFAVLGLVGGGLALYWLWDPERRRAEGWR